MNTPQSSSDAPKGKRVRMGNAEKRKLVLTPEEISF